MVIRNIYTYATLESQELHTCISSSSCHQICIFHLSMRLISISLKRLISSNEQGRARRVHCIMDAVFSLARLHSHMVSSLKCPHFCLCSLLHANPVHSLFRHLVIVHGLSYPLARLLLRLMVTLCGVICSPFITPYELRRKLSSFHTMQEAVQGRSLCMVL